MSRLKSLELQGYKTFANRTLFEFPEPITAVVGPNGSGKSNVSDAIRWVLGEQSFSLLRARKTEDMIFSGSEAKPRAGMATATIVFDNHDGWLPIDFSEVAITRRAYRDGQNEYFLNGQKVRLKEISELLAQSGLAERTYTIVGQGAVDSALSLKPDERRRFFEEAAGIGLYRSRRDEAIQRLDTTRRNLERLADIVGELEPRLASLEKQAKRAEEYERIKADLKLLLREWYGYHWHKTQKDLEHSRHVVEAQEERLTQAKERYGQVETEMNGVRSKLSELRGQLNQWHTESSGLHQQREQISRNLAVLEARQHALVEQKKSLLSDLTRLEEEQTAWADRLQTSQSDAERLKNDLKEARTQLETARKNLTVRQIEREAAEKELRDVRRQLVANETRKVELSAKRNELMSRLEGLKKSQQSLAQSIAADSRNLIDAKTLLDKATRELAEAEEEKSYAEETWGEQRAQTRKLESTLKQSQDELNKLEGERSRAKAQLDVLVQAESSFSGLNQGAKYILESAKQGKLTGSFSSLSSRIEVPRDYEAAIAAVLGEHLDGVIINGKEELERVLAFVENAEKGRAVLIPDGLIKSSEVLSSINDPDFIGVASSLVNIPENLKTVMSLLLGQVVIVKNRSAAQRIINQIPLAARVVTLKGEIFWGNGVVIAGQETRGGVIARPRQKRELQEALETVNQKHKELFDQVNRLQKELEQCRQKEHQLDAEVRRLSQQVTQNNQSVQKANLAVEQVKQKAEFQKNQLSNLDGQIKRSDEEIKKVGDEIQGVSGKIEEFQTELRNKNRALAALPLDELQAQVVHWNTQQAVIERAVKDSEGRLLEYQNNLKQNENQQNEARSRLNRMAEQQGGQEDEKKQMSGQEAELNGAIQVLSEKIEPAEQDLIRVEKAQENIQDDLTAAQQAVSVAERYVAQAQLDVTRQRESLDSLRRKIEDDFGLVAFQYTTDVLSPTPLPLEGMVAELPLITEIPPEIEDNVTRQRALLRRMGAVNLDAKNEYDSVNERYEYMIAQIEDLKQADFDLQQVITELDELMRKEFSKTFNAVAGEFRQIFSRLFGGGSAKLVLVDKENPADSGVEIEARLPGRREQGLALLSGGERSLTAVALIFALLKVSPTPFCVLDEVDAALDEANVGRFCDLLKELSHNTQFVIITHNRNTVSASGVIYGVTMSKDSISQVISLRLDEVSDDMVK
ncbi:MAG: chromosome segregation protein SMC [Anaerolineae bacterium]|nr:chromosome segregation protein SMC [Anaerolineae bacterium]